MFLINKRINIIPIMILVPLSRHDDPLDGGGALGLGVVDVGTSLSQIDPFFTV